MDITQEQLDYLRKTHVHIALPCYGGQLFECVLTGLLKFSITCTKLGINFSVDTMVNESLITRGRNSLVAKFMDNSAATHIMWIDSDIGFEPEHIIALLLHNKDVVGGLYPKKTLPIDYVVNINPEAVGENGQIKIENGLIPVSRIGTGFMLVARHVFEKMAVEYPQLKFKNNIGLDPKFDKWMYTFYDTGISPDTNEYMSEDWLFSDRWRAIGGEIWADPNVKLDHSGYFRYPGSPEKLNQIINGPNADNGNIPASLLPKMAVRQDVTKNGAAKNIIK